MSEKRVINQVWDQRRLCQGEADIRLGVAGEMGVGKGKGTAGRGPVCCWVLGVSDSSVSQ